MEKHIQHLNKLASCKTTKYLDKKHLSGKILLNILYNEIGRYIPNDVCYEISLYLVYDTRSLSYEEVLKRYIFLFLYKEILNDSIQLMWRYKEMNYIPDDNLSDKWFVLPEDYLLYGNKYNYYYLMETHNCSKCGEYEKRIQDLIGLSI